MSFWRAAALMRVIHSFRKSPLRTLRWRWLWGAEGGICSWALRERRERGPRFPLAASSVVRRFFWALTARFTRATRELLPGGCERGRSDPQQLLQLLGVRRRDDLVPVQAALARRRLVLELVLVVGLLTHELARAGDAH